MGQHDRLISFLDAEAQALRERITGLRERDITVGVETGEGGDTRLEQIRHEAERKLAEIEGHLGELRSQNG